MPENDLSYVVKLVEQQTVEFGSYPQTKVTDAILVGTLNERSGEFPIASDSKSWTSYDYYISGYNTIDYMWYKDIIIETGDNAGKYRGVYFTSYRPYSTSDVSSTFNSYQDDNGYYANTIYWFEYEPISWRILKTDAGQSMILSNLILDAQQYYSETTKRVDGNKTIFPNNYKESDIRMWLNDSFYNTALSTAEKSKVLALEVDNSAQTTNNPVSDKYACENTNDNVFLLSYSDVLSKDYSFLAKDFYYDVNKQYKTTDYAKAQGIYVSTDPSYKGNSRYWTRSSSLPRNETPTSTGNGDKVSYISCYGYVYYDYYINHTSFGVVPSLWMIL